MEAWDESVAADQEDSAVHEWVHRRVEVTDGALDSERDTTLMEADHPGSEQNLGDCEPLVGNLKHALLLQALSSLAARSSLTFLDLLSLHGGGGGASGSLVAFDDMPESVLTGDAWGVGGGEGVEASDVVGPAPLLRSRKVSLEVLRDETQTLLDGVDEDRLVHHVPLPARQSLLEEIRHHLSPYVDSPARLVDYPALIERNNVREADP
mmetsp:Transcript_8372/g.28114  ORF Transcript_8372/g.28114 Transcript_8372/m.28114 type:complete len:209 (-) Transcript_8372:543-1169(-)